MWDIIKNSYRSGWAFMLACPLIFFIPVGVEMIQHIVEAQLGMYNSITAAKAAEFHPARMAFGMAKIAALTLMGYWVPRYIAAGHDPAAATRRDPVAERLFAVFFLVQMIWAATQLYLNSISPIILGATMLASMVIMGLLISWGVAAALGNPVIGPGESIKISGMHALWLGIFSFIIILPLMVPHYALGFWAMTGTLGAPLMWLALAIDAVLVGYLASVVSANVYYLADWISRKRGVVLQGVV